MADRNISSRFFQNLRDRTQQRRGERRRRKRTTVLFGLALLAMFVLGLPSIVSKMGMVDGMVGDAAAGYDWDVEFESLEFGWVTPVRIQGVSVLGKSGETRAKLDVIETDLTLMDLLRQPTDYGTIRVRGLVAEIAVADGRSSLEDDLAKFMSEESSGPPVLATLEIQDASVTVSDKGSGTAWFAGNIQSTVALRGEDVQVQATSVLTDPVGASGSLELGAVVSMLPGPLPADASAWQTEIRLKSVPLHAITLLKRRFPESASSLPDRLSGDASGLIVASQQGDGALLANFSGVEVRQLVAVDHRLGDRTWTNQMARLNGRMVYQNEALQTEQLQAACDFGNVTMTGNFPIPSSASPSLAWVETISGSGDADIDLARLTRAAPGLLPLRSGAEISEGRIVAKVNSGLGGDGSYRTSLLVESSPLRGTASGRPIQLEPVSVDATFAILNGSATAEKISMTSAFGTAIGKGDLRSGTGEFRLDFSRLASILQPLVEMPEASLRGNANGSVRWAASEGNQWNLSGDLAAQGLYIQLPAGQTIRQNRLLAKLEAVGVWGGDTLTELNRLNAELEGDGITCQAKLLQPVNRPVDGNPLPLNVQATGNSSDLMLLAAPWLPADLKSIDGTFAANCNLQLAADHGQISAASIDLQRPQLVWVEQRFSQPYLKLRFEGVYAWPENTLAANTLTLEGEAVSFAAVGHSAIESTQLEIGWRMNFERFQNSLASTTVKGKSDVQQVNYVDNRVPSTDPGYVLKGTGEGTATLKGRDGLWSIDTDLTAMNVSVYQSGGTTAPAANGFVGPVRNMGPQPTATTALWSEPNLQVQGVFRYDDTTGGAVADKVQIESEWFRTTVNGHLIWNDILGEVSLKGPAEIRMPLVANRLSALSGQPVELTGVHSAPLDLLVQRRADGALAVDLRGSLGWQSGRISGIAFESAVANFKVTDTTATIEPTTIPMELGRLHIAGDVHYDQNPIWFEQQPGRFAENIRLEPEMARKWLKYLAPLAADATEIAGTIDLDLAQCVVVPDQPERTLVSGQLSVQGVELNAGPLANQVIAGIEQLKNVSRGLTAGQPATRTRRLLTIPAQVVEFDMRNAVVTHQRMYFTVDDARVITSGSVAVDGRLSMTAQVPLDANWLGQDLQSLAGESITLPISGTLSAPRLNSAAIGQAITSLGAKAAQQTAENYLQQQVNRGLEKLLGR
ncbi:hypothetical protein FF011L_22480 [Roseimaritima multifibrata]|uniref:AsmA-like C-terminal domain-containing protein n=1 Tax=Roseimaritima multifibrata TaxID=1930274 RepID=A0A517MF17_9BACT|nr:hypothetical protein [Roseimaritima multifibrata]QDS93478.1 hypothetical protein FF011L_22480 [Roseimaritima multifibrata]